MQPPRRPPPRGQAPRATSGFEQKPGPRPENRFEKRLEKPRLVPQVTTLWDYPSQHYGDDEQGSAGYRGATPSYVIWNVLSRFSAPGETVLDPFCGSGTTLDVCRDLGRKGIGYDLQPTRPDITKGDARSVPLKNKSVELVFMDPPYADNLAYSDDPRCIGKLKADGRYQRAMRMVLKETHRVLHDGRTLAIFVCDVLHKGKAFHPLGFELSAIAQEEGFALVDIVAVVRHNKTLSMGNYRKAADEQGFFLRGFNYLLLFRKQDRVERAAPREPRELREPRSGRSLAQAHRREHRRTDVSTDASSDAASADTERLAVFATPPERRAPRRIIALGAGEGARLAVAVGRRAPGASVTVLDGDGVRQGPAELVLAFPGALDDLPALAAAARQLLGRRGRFCAAFPASSLPSLFPALGAAGLFAKRLCLLHPNAGAPATLALVEAQPGRPGGLVITSSWPGNGAK